MRKPAKRRVGRPTAVVKLSESEREELEGWTRRNHASVSLALRARIILACAAGKRNPQIARVEKVSLKTISQWRVRFSQGGIAALSDKPRSGAPRQLSDASVEQLITATLRSKPKNATHWSLRSMAAESGMSVSSIGRIWRTFGLQPHRQETFKLSNDPHFVDKVQDIVGLYLSPPEHAVVLCVDEKSQIQALDRTQPLLPVDFGQPERRTHDYVRHGTTTLFAALNAKSGEVIGQCHKRHRATEYLKFLKTIDDQVPTHLDIHLIVDNYATHKTAAVKRWFVRHPRFHAHFTPTSSSWLNLVERWFGLLTERQIRRGTHRSTTQLQAAIEHYIALTNSDPKPFVWTKTADQILQSVAAYCERIAINKGTSGSGH